MINRAVIDMVLVDLTVLLYHLQYFELLSHLLEVYPEKVAQLNADAFKYIVVTIDFGIHQQV